MAERIATPEPEPEIKRAIDNRRAMREALGRPSEAHSDWSELMGGRTLYSTSPR
jgi:hypothetical protein